MPPSPLPSRRLDQEDVLDKLNRATRNIATSVEPSVVHLEVYSHSNGSLHGSSGSGWIFDHAGHIVTNAHVVSESGKVLVQFFDGHVANGEVIGADAMSDIAVLKVDNGANLEPARRATGGAIERGDRVYAFGSPFGFMFSMSEGIVSGLGRSARTMMNYNGISNFIQTDAAVQPRQLRRPPGGHPRQGRRNERRHRHGPEHQRLFGGPVRRYQLRHSPCHH